jgi:hypothetical protein
MRESAMAAPFPRTWFQRLSADIWWSQAPPDYLNRFGTPKHPEDLGQHRCLLRLGDERLYQWEFERGEEEVRTAVPGALILDEPGLILSLMERGADLMYGPETVLTHYVKRAKQLKCWMTGPMEPPGKRRML